MIRAQSADGKIHEFPPETPQSVVDAAMLRYAGQQPKQPSVGQAQNVAYRPQQSPEPERGLATRAYDFVTGNTPQEFPNIGSFAGTENDSAIGAIAGNAGRALAPTEDAQADIIVSQYREQFPGISKRQDRYGNIYIDLGDGQKAYVNKPGLDIQDALHGAGQALSYLGAGKAAGAMSGLMGRATVGGLASGATSIAQDIGSGIAGSEQGVDLNRALVATAAGGAAELITPAAASLYRVIVPRKELFDPVAQRLTPAGLQALQRAGLDPNAISDDFAREFAKQAQGAARPLAQTARSAEAASLPVPVQLRRGQASNDPAQQMFESQAGKGVYGDRARLTIQQSDEAIDEQIAANAQAIQGRIAGGQPRVEELGQGGQIASNALNAARDAAKGQVDTAYQQARSLGNAAGVPGDAATEGMQRVISAVTQDHVLENVPKVARVLDGLKPLSNNSSVTIGQIFQTRQRLSGIRAGGGEDAVAAGKAAREIGAWLDDALSNALIQGDDKAIGAFKDAIAKNKEYASVFKTSDLVGKLTARNYNTGQQALAVSPESAANAIFGQAALGTLGKANATRDLMKLRNVLGPESEGWRALKEEAFLRLWSKSRGAATSSGGRAISGANFSKALDDLKSKNGAAYQLLFNENERKLIEQFSRVVSYAKTPAVGGVNTSNTAAAIANGIQRFMSAPFLGPRAYALMEALGVTKGLGDVMQGMRATRAIRPLPPGPRAATTSLLTSGAGQAGRDDALRAQEGDERSLTGAVQGRIVPTI